MVNSQERKDKEQGPLANLQEATELYLEEFPLTITSRSFLTTFHVSAHA